MECPLYESVFCISKPNKFPLVSMLGFLLWLLAISKNWPLKAVSLQLKNCPGDYFLDLPTYICFPSLKILNLEGFLCVDEASMERLVSSCPVLEDLAIARQEWDDVRIMKISTPSLKRLSIHPNVRCPNYDQETELNTLLWHEYLRHSGTRWELNVLSSLVEARVYVEYDIGLLNGISNVKHLVLTGEVTWELGVIIRDYALPTFNNLKKLELYVGKPVNWELLPNLLESSPNLEVLIFPETIEIFNFVGLPGELYLVEYLLECGEVLDRMTIYCYDFGRRPRMKKKMEGVIDEVLNFERSSTTCEVVFFA
ncbi:conserved hypothetical protein [Ricinus communis]|uniref:FBD domain-containing protein n=1 Tax=Ricinus communis TaxID=3988 RepID=B9SAJ0_RICCO|nr:conserved hypothetical protein [Ricinus communis]